MEPQSDAGPSRPRRSAWRFGLVLLFVLIAIVALSIRGFQIWSARAHTAEQLAQPTTIDFSAVPLADIINLFGDRYALQFRTELPDAERWATYNSTASLSQVLDEILDQHDCEYKVTFDGTILVRSKSAE